MIKKRLYSLDIFRICCAIFVSLFHARIHLDLDFKIFNAFLQKANIFMVAFFMLSGFSLYYVDWCKNNLEICVNNEQNVFTHIGQFYKKRLLSIYPLYIIIYLLYIIFFVVLFNHFSENELIQSEINVRANDFSIIKNLIIFPVEITLLQTVYNGSFSILHNGGTWFISCIFLCYLIYPFLSRLIYYNKKSRYILLIFLYLISSWSNVVRVFFQFGSIYSNPFFRIIEFFIGIIIADLCFDKSAVGIKKRKILYIFASFFYLFISLTIGQKFRLGEVELYNCFAIPVFSCILYISTRLEFNYPIKRFNNFISILSENTYAFFLSQFFIYFPIKLLEHETKFFDSHRDIKMFTLCSIFGVIITIFLHYVVEKPLKKLIIKS